MLTHCLDSLRPKPRPLCICGCNEPVSRSKRSLRKWSLYKDGNCAKRISDRKLYEVPNPGNECACGCGRMARISKKTGRPTLYASDYCRYNTCITNKRLGLSKRLTKCACGCGVKLEQNAKKPRMYATRACNARAWKKVHRKENVIPGHSPSSGVKRKKSKIKRLEKWARETLIVPPGHPKEGLPMALPPFGRNFLGDCLKSTTKESLLCLGRKNAKSAIVAVYCLGHLIGPLRKMQGGWRAGVCSVNKSKARELTKQIEQIAEASGLAGELIFRRSPWPGKIVSRYGQVEILAGDSGMGGHSASLDEAIIDEIGLLGERDRGLVASMRAATSAKNGRFIALSIWGSGPYIPEIVKRRRDPGVVVHLYQASSKDCDLLNRTEWENANPGLGTIKATAYMEHESRRAKSTPSDEIFFRSQDLNLPGSPSVERIVSPSDWKRCNGPQPERDGKCVLGIDLGGSASMTAAVALWPGSGRMEVFGAFPTIPGLEARQRRDGIRYDMMIKSGELSLHHGRMVRVGVFLQSVYSKLAGERVQVLAADRYRRAETEQALADAGCRSPVVWRGTGASATADGSHDVRAFQRLVMERKIFHGDSLMLSSAVAGSKLRYDGAGNPALDKRSGLSPE